MYPQKGGFTVPIFALDTQNALYYEHTPPTTQNHFTFCFFNALTGDTDNWEGVIAPLLRRAGHGTLAYNMRGQAKSPFSTEQVLDETLIVDDAVRLLDHVEPSNPILVGLSIGGLFAARTWLKRRVGNGLVLINTLRENNARLKWIGDALVRAVEVGGLELFRDLFLPLLVNNEWLEKNRSNFLAVDGTYSPLDPESGHYRLLAQAGRTSDWDLPYEMLDLPTLVITGLQDHVFLDLQVVDAMYRRLPRATRVDLPEAGHLIPAEHPHRLVELFIQFTQEL
jgi:pimeloyl-ACP methyl ester carboxylesterase